MTQFDLPSSLDAERFVLGAVMSKPESFSVLASVLTGAEFTTERHRRIFGVMRDLHEAGRGVDRVSVAVALKDRGQLEHDGISYLADLDDGLPDIFDADDYVRIVRDKYTLRQIISACQKAINSCVRQEDEPAVLIQRAEGILREIGASSAPTRGPRVAGDVVADNREMFFNPQQSQRGIETPWPWLNRMILGLRPGQMILLAARPSVGKTAMAMQVAMYAASRGIPVQVFSLEMPAEELLLRVACGAARVDSMRQRKGELNKEERERFRAAVASMQSVPLWFDDTTRCSVSSLHAGIRRVLAKQGNVGLVVIDYIGLMQSVGRAENRNQEVAAISRGVKLASREFNIPFLVLAQFSRAHVSDGRKPGLHDLRDSGTLEQDADAVLFLHPVDEAEKANPSSTGYRVELIIAKQRNGPIGSQMMWFEKQTTQFDEVGNDVDYRSKQAGG